jgi:hypothetical protein
MRKKCLKVDHFLVHFLHNEVMNFGHLLKFLMAYRYARLDRGCLDDLDDEGDGAV